MTNPPADSGTTRLPKLAMVAGAMTASMSGVQVSYGSTPGYGSGEVRGAAMTPQEQDLIFAKVDAKVADLRGDLRLNTQGLADLKERFGDLASKMASVPADLAAMKRDIAHLPSKEELGKKLRFYLGFAVVGASLINAGISWGPKLFGP